MNEFTRYRAGNLHPNPGVHRKWWAKNLKTHRVFTRTPESTIRKYMKFEVTPWCPSRYDHSQMLGHSESTHMVSTVSNAKRGGKSPDRPRSAAGTLRDAEARNNNFKYQGGNSGSHAKKGMTRPQSAGVLGFRPPQNQMGSNGPSSSSTYNRPAPADNKRDHGSSPSSKLGSTVLLASVLEQMQGTLDDLDEVETNVKLSNVKGDIKKQIQGIKLQFAELAKELDGVHEQLANGANYE